MTRSAAKDILVIDSLNALYLLYQEAQRARPARFAGVRVQMPALSSDENLAWERQLQRLHGACGCGEATAAGLLATAVYVAWVLAYGQISLASALGVPVAFFLVGAIGKLVGLKRARLRLRRAVIELRDRVGAAAAEAPDAWPPSLPVAVGAVRCGNP